MGTFHLNTTLVRLIFLLFSFTALLLPLSSYKTHSGDIKVLNQLKQSIDPNSVTPGSCVSSWDFSLDPCDTLFGEAFTCGFTCDAISGTNRITQLTLDQAGYSAPLSSTPWDRLSFLNNLDLSNNNFSGPIPDSLSKLTRLSRLTLSGNLLSGRVPDSLGNADGLEELYLDNNKLEGPLPASLNGLVSLKRMELQGNEFSGELPDFSGLGQLYYLDAGENSISGELPTGLPAALVELSLRDNLLQGSIPLSVPNSVGYLQVLDLSHNQLSGSVPSGLFTHPSLQQLTLSGNNFTSFSLDNNNNNDVGFDQSSLIAVDLSDNELGGLLPEFLGQMPKLSALNLENNKLTGMIPIQYALKTALPDPGTAPFERLLLGGNYLFGPIPGPLMVLQPGSVNVSLAGNCLFRCPNMFFFCRGSDQKSLVECRGFAPVIP